MRILMISFFILILGLMDFLNPLRFVFQKFTAPIQFGMRRTAIGIKDSANLFYNINRVREENLRLLQENRNLQGIIIDLKKAEEENKLLRNQLELKNRSGFDKDLLLASVMGNSEDLTGTSIVIDKGEKQGVKVGDNVVKGTFLVGIVREVSPGRSIVDFVTSPEVSITVVNLSETEGIAQGNLGTSILVNRLLPGESVEIGDVFVTSGKDGRFLPNLNVGYVTEVTYESADPLRSAILIPGFDYAKIDKVFVILN